MKKGLVLLLALAFTFAFAGVAMAYTPVPSVIGPDGASVWSYQDAYDVDPKYEGGYLRFNDGTMYASDGADYQDLSLGNVPWYDQDDYAGMGPHGGYDTTTNKCKTCHAVHRAEGTYYLLRANSQDDACSYCHIDGPAYSNTIVYSGNDAGIFTPNGHTMGAASEIPDSTVSMNTVEVELIDGEASTAVLVRQYDEQKKQLYRTVAWGRSPAGHPTIGNVSELAFGRVGPTPLSCSNCHQVHNAFSQIWQPLGYRYHGDRTPGPPFYSTNVDPEVGKLTEGYKLLRRFPGATGNWGTGGQTLNRALASEIAKVPETTLTADVNYSTTASKAGTYVEDGITWRQPDWVVGTDFNGQANLVTFENTGFGAFNYAGATVSQYGLSVWCADCHNLNIGASTQVGDSELGFFKAHAERTHPVPATRGFQCYSCHRADLGYGGTGGACTMCHYYPGNYKNDHVTSDFPHAGNDQSVKLLGSFSLESAPPAAGGNWTMNYVETTITANNLDAVCLRCHSDQGVHQ